MNIWSLIYFKRFNGALAPLNLVQTFALSFADGLFGQCRGSKHGVVQYQVTVPVLKRMQEVLKQLMLQGLSWQDDITQYILSKELKRVPHSTLSLKPNSSSPSSQLSQYVLFNGLLQRISRVLQKYRIDPRDLSQEQLYKLALILQLLQAQDKPGTVFIKRYQKTEKDVSYVSVWCPPLLFVCFSSVVGPALTFRIRVNEHNMTAADVAAKNFLESETGLKIVQTGVGERTDARGLPHVARVSQGSSGTVVTLVSMAVVGGVLVLAMAVACFRHYAQQVANGKLGLGPEGGAETHFDYQELCRQHMASKSSLRGTDTSRVSSVSSQFSDGPQHSPSSTHSSTPSWSEEPAQSNMDISTGHMILTYMEDHLRNKDRLQKEWEALCSYQAEPSSVAVAQLPNNVEKNRHAESLPYDHSRVKLKADVNPNKQDYVNASIIFDHDPRQPSYIATQGPLPHTVTDFWQMVWENGCTVIVMMSALVEDGEKQCERYWPDEGSSLYHIYEVNLVSEHIWCKDFLVRSFYLKNVQTQETRTVTQFHLLSWPAHGIPTSTRPLLDFRRKVNKCYRGRSCPIIVHCSDGTGRTGTYILIDMVLNRMAKGVKEIDIAATLEHIRDQRPSLVRTKDQFEFALTAVAEEVNAILKALPQ
uniref:Receptor-type tyrosine-protein phosphatase-like N n=1 Tax=Gouania willdenowi TaxID=441366 RepID=A0A8C5HQE8_GOUWI